MIPHHTAEKSYAIKENNALFMSFHLPVIVCYHLSRLDWTTLFGVFCIQLSYNKDFF